MARTSRDKKLKELLYDVYRALYANSEPQADFDELVANARVDEEGRKVIPYDNYEIDGDLMDEIFENLVSRCKWLTKSEKQCLKFNVYLGCSPRTKMPRIQRDE